MNKKNFFKISNVCVLALSISYVIYHFIAGDGSVGAGSLHFILFFLFGSLFYCLRIVLHAFVYFILYEKYTKDFYSKLGWLRFFSISQLYGAFIPGAAFAMRAYVIKDKYNVTITNSAMVYFTFYLSSLIIFFVIVLGYLFFLPHTYFDNYRTEVNFFGIVSISSVLILVVTLKVFSSKIIHRINFLVNSISLNIWLELFFLQAVSLIFTFFSFAVLFYAINIETSIFDLFNTFVVLQSLVYIPQFLPGNIGIQEAFLAFTGGAFSVNDGSLLLYSLTARILMLAGSLILFVFSFFCTKIKS